MSTVKMVKFVNPTSELFAHTSLGGNDENCRWDGVGYSFKPGDVVYLEDWKAEHFAKHLINRELTKNNIPTDRQVARDELRSKCFVSEDQEEIPESKIESTLANKNKKKVKEPFCVDCDSKGVRHKKTCPSLLSEVKTVEEENSEFEGLDK